MLISFLTFVFGTIFGSFFNVIIYRLPKNLSLVTPRSHCTNCEELIPFYRNIPIITYYLQMGKCHSCNQKISIQYPIVELLTGLIFLYGLSLQDLSLSLYFTLISSIILIISFIDYRTLSIPVKFIGLLYLILIIRYFQYPEIIFDSIIGSFVCFAYLLISLYSTKFIFKKDSPMGSGDILFGIFIGGILGPINGLFAIFSSAIIMLLAAFSISIVRKEKVTDQKFPFIPSLSLGFMIFYIMSIESVEILSYFF